MKDHKSFEKKTLFIAETLCQVYLRENLEHFENNLNVRIWIKYLNERQKSNTIRNATNEPTPNAPKRLKFKDARMSDLWNSRPSRYFQGLVFYLVSIWVSSWLLIWYQKWRTTFLFFVETLISVNLRKFEKRVGENALTAILKNGKAPLSFSSSAIAL